MNKALNALKLVGNLAAYNPDPADSERIMAALNGAVQEVAVKFKGRQRGNARTFDL